MDQENKLIKETIAGLKEMGRGTGREIAIYINHTPQDVIIVLNYLQDTSQARCINGIWRLLAPLPL
ncbi:hypothetical protein [Klebsiella aerogenes]|uniref:hypothetical protein n=1 Tax=Klebsiella aerogenes TaxID=548 RepID=UPI001F32A717|nr:hypothetical protein [Klebsiella aerogenes]